MKTFNKILTSLAVAAVALSMGSCVNDLDLTPVDPASITAGSFKDDPEGYMNRVMADVYLSFAVHGPNNSAQVHDFDGGMSTFERAIFNLEEVPSDECSWLSSVDAPIYSLTFGTISSDNRAVFGAYSRLIINIALCNDFISTVNKNLFALSTDDEKALAAEYVRQCKTLRSACYFYLINFFGDVPYATENDPMGTVAPQLSRSRVFDLVTATLEDVVAEYDANPYATPYGYVGKDLAEGMLVKFYLNAGVFTGTPRWADCVTVAQKLINEHKGTGFEGSGLANHYLQVFAANNDQYAPGGSNAVKEILWVIPEKYPELMSYGGATVMLLGWLDPTLASEVYNVGNGWRCIVAREQFTRKMEWETEECTSSKDERLANWQTAANDVLITNEVMDQAHFLENGYLAVKLRNLNMDEDGNYDETNKPPFQKDSYVSCDWPMLRLSEIYLSAAEAMLQGGGSKADALEYVNLIRRRAGLQNWSADQLTLETLQDERCRELYSECTRRTDLIRYGKWISGYTWNWKNNAPAGTDFPSHYNLYPLPPEVISQAGYTQNPDY